ncbi:MAG TPA: hypothetical protein VMU77_07640 [Acidimicrobiales bacterium]|nr:hypothetical protein [Acidimicrobiales bacterium]
MNAVDEKTGPANESPTKQDEAHGGPEWQPWDGGSKFILAMGIIAVLALVAVFVSLTLPVH